MAHDDVQDPLALVASMTPAEKASLLSGADFWSTQAVPRVGIGSVVLTDGPHGVRRQRGAADHVGLGDNVPATCFPPAAALGSTWDVDLLTRVGAALGREARALGVSVLLGPGINIKRSPLCGRNFEYLSEDPLLSGVLGAALVRGVQSAGVGASVKHYAANNAETDRMRVSADVDERTLRETYLRGFERVVRTASPWTVMCAYNALNGVLVSQNRWLLTDVLRDEWGYDGLVVSDWGAVRDRVAALAAGLDLEMPGTGGGGDARVVAAVGSGELAEAVVDTAVGRVLALLERVGAPGPAGALPDDVVVDHHALAHEAATRSAVLLSNDGVLPLRLPADARLAVLGEFARTPRFQGAGSSQVTPTRLDTALDALRSRVPDGVTVDFAAGFTLDDVAPDGQGDDALVGEAVDLAGRADAVVVFLGLPSALESEGFDREHLDLPGAQRRLLREVAAGHGSVVVVLSAGGATTTDWAVDVGAVLHCWLGGQAGGSATADLLLGHAEPSGRLAETLPVRLADTPAFLDFPGEQGHLRYGEGVFVGYRWFDARDLDVAYPFGHGLSYTTFSWTDLSVAVTDGSGLVVEVTVTNTGRRRGREVVQVYVGDPSAPVRRPERELRGLARVDLEPGQSERVQVRVDGADLAWWSTAAHRWRLEGGELVVSVGASSRDLRLVETVVVEGDGWTAPLDEVSTLAEWLAHPVGGPLLRERVGSDADGRALGVLGDDEMLSLVGSMPLVTLAGFSMGLTPDDVPALLAAVATPG